MANNQNVLCSLSFGLTRFSRLFWLTSLLACLYNPTAIAGSTSQAEERVATVGMRNETFFFQDSCRGMLEIGTEQLAAMLSSKDQSLFEKFCSLEEEMSCIDYDDLVREWGYLKVSNAPGFCRFVPIGSN